MVKLDIFMYGLEEKAQVFWTFTRLRPARPSDIISSIMKF